MLPTHGDKTTAESGDVGCTRPMFFGAGHAGRNRTRRAEGRLTSHRSSNRWKLGWRTRAAIEVMPVILPSKATPAAIWSGWMSPIVVQEVARPGCVSRPTLNSHSRLISMVFTYPEGLSKPLLYAINKKYWRLTCELGPTMLILLFWGTDASYLTCSPGAKAYDGEKLFHSAQKSKIFKQRNNWQLVEGPTHPRSFRFFHQ